MKKIIILSLVAVLSYGANASAAALASGTASTAGISIFGGADATTAATAQNRLVSFSKGVQGAVVFTATANTSTGYVLVGKHTSGTKTTGTSNDSTKMYWKQSAVATSMPTGDIPNSALGTTAFAGSGWTEY